jgi:hydroxymethylpyrimidine/phosphomethylpyrimidine kinase
MNKHSPSRFTPAARRIQADEGLRAHGVFGAMSSGGTAQNTSEVRRSFDVPVDLVRAQLDPGAGRPRHRRSQDGMLSSAAIIDVVADVLEERRFENRGRPVMVSKRLPAPPRRRHRSPHAAWCPSAGGNAQSARSVPLAGMPIASLDDMEHAAAHRRGGGPRGGGRAGTRTLHWRSVCCGPGKGVTRLQPEGDVTERSVHGTGCTFSAAIAARIARRIDRRRGPRRQALSARDSSRPSSRPRPSAMRLFSGE